MSEINLIEIQSGTFEEQIAVWFKKYQEWGNARNIINGSGALNQFLKLISEYGEMGGHLGELSIEALDSMSPMEHNEFTDALADDIGDNLVVLAMIAAQMKVEVNDIFAEISDSPAPDIHNALACYALLGKAYGQMADAICKADDENFLIAIGEAIWLLREMANEFGMGVSYCCSQAWTDIKDRKGVMFNGVFVKSTDRRYVAICIELGLEQ